MRFAPTFAALTFALCSGVASAQSHPESVSHGSEEATSAPVSSEISSLLESARALSERYRDRKQAIQDGFRRLGPDFPSMGEHWIHPGRMVSGVIDPDRPQALSYADIRGEVTLTGVIYAKPLGLGEAPPEFPRGVNAWHDHSGSVDAESVVLQPSVAGAGSDTGFRLAMLHVWLYPVNPNGVFESANWALPFVRLSLEAPHQVEPDAAKALSLASSGDAYFSLLFRLQTQADENDIIVVTTLIAAARREVEQWLAQRPSSSRVTLEEMAILNELWDRLWTDIRTNSSAAARDSMESQGLSGITSDH